MCWWDNGVCPNQDVGAELAETIATAHGAGQMAAWQKGVKAVGTTPQNPPGACGHVQNALTAAQAADWGACEAELDMVIDPAVGNQWDVCPGAIDEFAEIIALAHRNNEEPTWRQAIKTICATPIPPPASCDHVKKALVAAQNNDWVLAVNELDNAGV